MVYTILIDNEDSFTANLEHLLIKTIDCKIVTINYSQLPTIDLNDFNLLVISPGPGRPADYPDYRRLLDFSKPVLGICLGMQIVNELYGGETGRSKNCVHGKTDQILFGGRKFRVARYNSLAVTSVSEDFETICENSDGIPMALRHRAKPIIGYQFHPESFLTENGRYFIEYASEALFKD